MDRVDDAIFEREKTVALWRELVENQGSPISSRAMDNITSRFESLVTLAQRTGVRVVGKPSHKR